MSPSYRLPFAVCRLPFAVCRLPFAACRIRAHRISSIDDRCRLAVSDQAAAIRPPAPTHDVPLRFARHNFEALCFNTIGCKLAYAGRYQVNRSEGSGLFPWLSNGFQPRTGRA